MVHVQTVSIAAAILLSACSDDVSSSRCVPLDKYPQYDIPDRFIVCEDGWTNAALAEAPEGTSSTRGEYVWKPEPGRECDGCLWEGVEVELAGMWRSKFCPSQPEDVIQHVAFGCYAPHAREDDQCVLKFYLFHDGSCTSELGHPEAPVIP